MKYIWEPPFLPSEIRAIMILILDAVYIDINPRMQHKKKLIYIMNFNKKEKI